ncbi:MULTISPECIES: hypothetical protein [unclassified Rhizobium]|uniref:hypothetical protein n=1 Tax=unclassified Rhizobium TaxID=2613769 RepID=UPI000A64F72E|nr:MULTISPECIES: hypothetical protein [unclassified Rhizobium]
MKGLRSAIGMKKNIPVPAFERFCAEIAPNPLKFITKSGSPLEVVMPHGNTAEFARPNLVISRHLHPP